MKRKFRPAIHLLLPLMLLFFPLGLFFIVRLDMRSVEYTIQDRSEYLKSVLTSIDYSFSSYEQLISTTVTIVETLPSDRTIHEDSLRSIFSSSQSALVYGIGIWYEPFAFNDETERFGPYIRQTKPLEKESEITYFWNTPDYNYHGREWYKTSLAAEGDRPSVTPPFFDHDYTYITFGKPFYRDGKKAGVITIDIILPLLQGYFINYDFSDFSGVYLTTSDGSIVISRTIADKEDLDRYALEGNQPGLFVDRTATYSEEEIFTFFESIGQKPAIIDHETRNGVFKIHGFLDRTSLFKNIVRRHIFNYFLYLFFWASILLVIILSSTYQARLFENQLLNSENDQLKEEVRRRIDAEEKLEFLAFHDEASGLDNLFSFFQTEEAPVRYEDKRSLITITLSNMRELSLILSDSIIDEVIAAFAQRLKDSCSRVSRLFRGRGFTFYVVTDGEEGRGIELAESLLQEFRKPILMGNRDLRLRIKIGFVPFYEADSLDQLLSMSHSTVSDESARDIDKIALYSSSVQDHKARTLVLDTAMSQPGFTGELNMVFQPIVSTSEHLAVGCEALVRWNSRALGSMISPAEFIPLAEENGLIINLGWYVIEEVLKILSGPLGDREFFITVNVSPLQFLEIDFPEKLDRLVDSYSLDRKRIKLEITESSAAAVIEAFWQIADDLIGRGYRLAIDDFGTGESSFHRLYHMSFDSLKIDRSFITGVSSGLRNQEICRSLLEIGNTMGSRVIAEGVETEGELQALKEIGIQYVQGYFFARPMTLEELLESPLLMKS